MAYDEHLADRIHTLLSRQCVEFEEKKMMGGLCFMVDQKMCIGISHDQMMARIDPNIYAACLTREGCHEMNFTGRALKGFVFVDPEAIDEDADLNYWVQLCLEYNPKAKRSKK
ncbi:RNA methyltransferase [Candidatus Peregrinibacteria bacterium CG10_big_fil_rev_8_21_14_0_10_49_10]|nr:MAG: RNA methyltransferase [Candidatus Peregrinibacteria bacterium CG10_big_fil_rev_8_21_14_0_10_49_10]